MGILTIQMQQVAVLGVDPMADVRGNWVGPIYGLNYPTTDGTAGQVITTDGAGNLSWTNNAGGGGGGGGIVLTDLSVTQAGASGSGPLSYASATGVFTYTIVLVTNINGLSDVDTNTVGPTNGQALVWDAAGSKWKLERAFRHIGGTYRC